MAQFDFLGTWDDSWGIVAAILDTGGYSLIPDLLYEKPEPVSVTQLDESATGMLREAANGFLWSEKFSRYPPVMSRIEGGEGDGKYYVSPVEGGPYLRLSLPRCFEEDGVINLTTGTLYYPKWTTKPGSNIAEKPSPELRKVFNEVKALIKRQLVRLNVRPDIWPGGIWGGRGAARLLEEGRARV